MIITSFPKPGLRRLLAGGFILLLALSLQASPRSVLVLGDSISAAYGMALQQGWVALLRERLRKTDPGAEVINASISGETTAGGLARLPRLLQQHNPAVLVLELGGNDGLRGYPLAQMRENLDAMITMARDAGTTVALVPMEIPPNYGPLYTQGFRHIYTTLGEQPGVILTPFPLQDVATDAQLMQDDGIHPTAKAQPLILETIMPALQEALQP